MKTNLLVFIPEFPRLSETFIQREVAGLLKRNNLNIAVLSIKKGEALLTKELTAVTHYIKLTPKVIILGMYHFFTKHPLRTFIVLISGVFNSPKYLVKSFGFAYLAKDYSPTHIHVHFLSDFSTYGMYMSRLLGVTFSISAHARDVFVNAHLVSLKAKYCKFIAVCNVNAYEQLLTQVIDSFKAKIHLLYHGIDIENLFSNIKNEPKPDIPLIYMGGLRLVSKKGISYAIKASKLLKDRGIKHKFIAVGAQGDLYNELQAEILDLGLKNTFYILGNGNGLPHTDVLAYYLKAQVFVFSGIKSEEGDVDGVPNVLLEAAAAKLPCVVTDVGSVKDIVEHGVTGFIVPQKDPKNIARAVEVLLQDKSKRELLGERIYAKVAKLFDNKETLSKLEELLCE
ncbi:glycosyltransferase family 4 protein [candidate division WWE3 bacterium]|uniref:Glycosyltransferase family 4 protein n=1 Tax=candidate division WWE3 bacterium TaxID=2053526 RepID=A0A955EEH9_UNCKA|nr:glycosyltransferase family 4 protein [candidate division WWE3 bacterium]